VLHKIKQPRPLETKLKDEKNARMDDARLIQAILEQVMLC